jgi:hypothetical protein
MGEADVPVRDAPGSRHGLPQRVRPMTDIVAMLRSSLALAPLSFALCAQASELHAGNNPLRLSETANTETVCAGQLPSGWIKVDDAWNPTTCGNPTSKTYNVWMIAQYSEKPIGFVMVACNGAAPAGWVIVGTTWNPTTCGHPTANQKNMMTIKRLN